MHTRSHGGGKCCPIADGPLNVLIATQINGAIVLGLDAESVRRLKAGQPIVKDLSNFGGTDTVVIIYGETMADITKELEDATGQKLPPLMPAPGRPSGKPS